MPTELQNPLRSPSGETLNFMLSRDGFGCQELIDASTGENQVRPSAQIPRQLSELPADTTIFQGLDQELARNKPLKHPLFRNLQSDGRAGNVTLLDHRIAHKGGTTSNYEELPHRLKMSKKYQSTTPQN
jgi:hypothetical protein